MSGKRYVIEQQESFIGAGDEEVFIYEVRHHLAPLWDVIEVWGYPESKPAARCTACSTMLTAMRSDCPHAKAVARYIQKHPPVSKL